MFQAFKELKAARGRTLLITGTVGMIAVLVSFLSGLTGGLSHQSVSELDRIAGPDSSLVIADLGTPTLAASTLTPEQVEQLGGTSVYTARTKVGDTPAMLVSNPDVPAGQAKVSTKLSGQSATVAAGNNNLKVTGEIGDFWLDHQPIVEVNPQDIASMTAGPNAVVVKGGAPSVEGTKALAGSEKYKVSSSYVGENMSLSTMTYLLFAISALVVGAFFTVWTMQRLRGVAISSALGAARKVIAADALAQALSVLLVGVTAGVLVTVVAGSFLSPVMPMVVSAQTTILPGVILVICGLLGAAFSLRPVLTVNPRSALNAA